ncbi:hypothetical protein EVAR_42043_1 [Eumeta japonica]|uniref:Uncharacterized protein n=1 Tax=Eumeta variegata TaxID=151549 RepID=A0A4C1Y6Q1_EUMVA|nr:hypothetical protein EVAR_42043_1 [Eumeta japonica]
MRITFNLVARPAGPRGRAHKSRRFPSSGPGRFVRYCMTARLDRRYDITPLVFSAESLLPRRKTLRGICDRSEREDQGRRQDRHRDREQPEFEIKRFRRARSRLETIAAKFSFPHIQAGEKRLV